MLENAVLGHMIMSSNMQQSPDHCCPDLGTFFFITHPFLLELYLGPRNFIILPKHHLFYTTFMGILVVRDLKAQCSILKIPAELL